MKIVRTVSSTANTTVYESTTDDGSATVWLVDVNSEETTYEFNTQSEAETFAASKE